MYLKSGFLGYKYIILLEIKRMMKMCHILVSSHLNLKKQVFVLNIRYFLFQIDFCLFYQKFLICFKKSKFENVYLVWSLAGRPRGASARHSALLFAWRGYGGRHLRVHDSHSVDGAATSHDPPAAGAADVAAACARGALRAGRAWGGVQHLAPGKRQPPAWRQQVAALLHQGAARGRARAAGRHRAGAGSPPPAQPEGLHVLLRAEPAAGHRHPLQATPRHPALPGLSFFFEIRRLLYFFCNCAFVTIY